MCLRYCFSVFLFLLSFQRSHGQAPCRPPKGKPNCVCNTKEGIIDLTSISNKHGKPQYTDLRDSNEYTYLFNPCHGFGVGNTGCTHGTVACQNDKFDPEQQFSCGDISTETFIYSEVGNSRLEYNGGDAERTTIVTLHCDWSATTPIINTTGDSIDYFVYRFDIRSVCACPGGCPEPGSGVAPGAIGLSLIFISLGALVSYFVISVLILKFRYKKTGWELIPHREFWFGILFLVKDGCKFTRDTVLKQVNRIRNKEPKYESL